MTVKASRLKSGRSGSGRGARRVFAFIAALALSASTALATDGAIPIYEPTTISTPGRYVLTRNIVASTTPITVNASDVAIDLNGFTLERDTSGPVIQIGNNRSNIEVRNGTLMGGSWGINYWPPASDSPGLRLVVRNVRFLANSDNGIRMIDESLNPALTVTDSEFVGIGFYAVYANSVQGSATSMSVTLRDNTFRDLGSAAIWISDCASAHVSDNLIDGYNLGGTSWYYAVFLEAWAGATFSRNLIVNGAGANAVGVKLESGSTIFSDNVLTGNNVTVNPGVYVNASGALISGNRISGFKNGLLLYGARHTVADNSVTGNAEYGLLWAVDGGSVYRNNMLRGNGIAGVGGPTTTNTDAGGNYQ